MRNGAANRSKGRRARFCLKVRRYAELLSERRVSAQIAEQPKSGPRGAKPGQSVHVSTNKGVCPSGQAGNEHPPLKRQAPQDAAAVLSDGRLSTIYGVMSRCSSPTPSVSAHVQKGHPAPFA